MDDLLNEPLRKPRRKRWILSPFLIVSIVLHLIFIGGAAIYVVSRYSANRKLTFQAGPKSPNPSEQALQHRIQLEKKKNTQTVPAAVPKRVLTTGLAKVALPPMPEIPAPKTANAPTMNAAAATGKFGAGARMNSSLGGTGSGSAINFFGLRDTSSSVVIMIDVSDSMFTRTGDAEKSKLLKLGRSKTSRPCAMKRSSWCRVCSPNISFGIVRWSGGAYSWKPELVPATEENKQAAIAHIQSEVDFHRAKKKPDRPGGTRHDYALEEAFKLKPETIYMITDGNATGESPNDSSRSINADDIFRAADEGQKSLRKKARLHAIYYLTGEDKPNERQMLTDLATRNGGNSCRWTPKAAVKAETSADRSGVAIFPGKEVIRYVARQARARIDYDGQASWVSHWGVLHAKRHRLGCSGGYDKFFREHVSQRQHRYSNNLHRLGARWIRPIIPHPKRRGVLHRPARVPERHSYWHAARDPVDDRAGGLHQ